MSMHFARRSASRGAAVARGPWRRGPSASTSPIRRGITALRAFAPRRPYGPARAPGLTSGGRRRRNRVDAEHGGIAEVFCGWFTGHRARETARLPVLDQPVPDVAGLRATPSTATSAARERGRSLSAGANSGARAAHRAADRRRARLSCGRSWSRSRRSSISGDSAAVAQRAADRRHPRDRSPAPSRRRSYAVAAAVQSRRICTRGSAGCSAPCLDRLG